MSVPLKHFCRSSHGFTLIELLVVVSIISLLISISMPSLTRARQQALGVVCMTTLREFNTGIFAYGLSYDGRAPTLDFQLPSGRHHSWAEALYKSDFNYQPDLNADYPALTNKDGQYEIFTCKAADQRENSTGHYRVWKPGWSGILGGQANMRCPMIFDAVCDDESDVKAYGRTSPVVNPNRVTNGTAQPYDGRQADDGVIGIKERHYGGANYLFPDHSVRRSTILRSGHTADPNVLDLTVDFDQDGIQDKK